MKIRVVDIRPPSAFDEDTEEAKSKEELNSVFESSTSTGEKGKD